jgi:tetratricopeptide (TPR) repeat protein
MEENYSVTFWKNLGDDYVKGGHYSQGVYCYKVALHYGPDSRSVYNNLGYAYQKMGKEEEARSIKKKLDELPVDESQQEVRSKKSIFDEPLTLFFVFFIVMWVLISLLLYNLSSASGEMIFGIAVAGLLAFLLSGLAWAFFFLWDNDTIFTRVLALLITGVIGGVILILFRTAYTRILSIQ